MRAHARGGPPIWHDLLGIDNLNADVLYGNQGDDTLSADNAFAATEYRGQGNDSLFQQEGAHGVLYGNEGDDLVEDVIGAGFDNARNGCGAAEGSWVLYGGQGDDSEWRFAAAATRCSAVRATISSPAMTVSVPASSP